MSQIKYLFEKNKTDVVYIRASSEIKYGKVASLMSNLKQNGIVNIALVTEIEQWYGKCKFKQQPFFFFY